MSWKEIQSRFGLDYEKKLMYEKRLKRRLPVAAYEREWPLALQVKERKLLQKTESQTREKES